MGVKSLIENKPLAFIAKKRMAGFIRGHQIGKYLKAAINPKKPDDFICIYAKCFPPENYPLGSFIDIVDGKGLLDWAEDHPDIGVIAISKFAQKFISKRLKRNDIHFIPEHHCNYERQHRVDRPVKTVGFIGSPSGLQIDIDILSNKFKSMGLNFIYKIRPTKRSEVVSFLSKIDIQMVYRPQVNRTLKKLRNPLKVSNAGSFGIPTVSNYEKHYDLEFNGCYVPVKSVDELFDACYALRESKVFYNCIADAAMKRSEYYHISNVAKKYRSLIT